MAAGSAVADAHTAGRQPQQPAPSVIDILRWGAPQAVDIGAPKRIRDTLAKLSLCRTHLMGGRKFRCQDCDEITARYNSCGDRNCPQCSGGKRVDFNENAAKRIIDGVVYYQVTMTLPSELSELAICNRQLFGELLPAAAWSSLSRSIRAEQGYRAGAISVLHTWNQQLENHWHVHLLVPGAGPSLDGRRWNTATPPPDSRNDEGFYLVDADRLRERFRTSFLRRLDHARATGKLKLTGRFSYLQSDENWTALKNQLASKTWVAHIQPPPTSQSQAQHVVNYLTRYVTGGPISDKRIVSADRREVTFLAREGNRVGGERKQIPITLSTREFTQRWSQHIQPDGLTRVRYFGGWSNCQAAAYQAQCLELAPSTPSSTPAPPEPTAAPSFVCQHCESERLTLIQRTGKPGWRELLGYGSESSPWWYAQLRDEDDRRFWDAAMGEGFNDWYLETLQESAKENEGSGAQPIQLQLAGFEASSEHLLDSL